MSVRAARLLLSGLLLILTWGCATRHVVPEPPGPMQGFETTAMSKSPGLYAIGPEGLLPKPYDDFSSLAQGIDYILVGEGHTSACDHTVQAALVDALVKAGRRPALALEMVGADMQPVLDTYNTDRSLSGAAFAEKLERDLDWAKRWGHAYDLYAPVFIRAYAAGLPFYAVNAPPQIVRKYSRGGLEALNKAERAYLPERIILPGEEQRQSLSREFEQHSAMLAKMRAEMKKKKGAKKRGSKRSMPPVRPGKSGKFGKPGASNKLDHFLEIQSLWDTVMAQGMADVKRRTGRQVVLFAGSGHVENGWGVARRLRLLDPGARILLVAPWRGGPFPKPEYADLVFHCPEKRSGRYGFTFAWSAESKGALIIGVKPGSVADKAGFHEKDIVVEMMGESVEGLNDLHTAAVRARKTDKPLLFTVLRDGRKMAIELPIWRIKIKKAKDAED